MAKAVHKHIAVTDHPQLTPEKYEIVDTDTVKVSLRDNSGKLVCFTMTFGMMIQSVNLATGLLNSNAAKIIDHIAAAIG